MTFRTFSCGVRWLGNPHTPSLTSQERWDKEGFWWCRPTGKTAWVTSSLGGAPLGSLPCPEAAHTSLSAASRSLCPSISLVTFAIDITVFPAPYTTLCAHFICTSFLSQLSTQSSRRRNVCVVGEVHLKGTGSSDSQQVNSAARLGKSRPTGNRDLSTDSREVPPSPRVHSQVLPGSHRPAPWAQAAFGGALLLPVREALFQTNLFSQWSTLHQVNHQIAL